MRVVITGGAGFLGMQLVKAILKRGVLTNAAGMVREVSEPTLIDVLPPLIPTNDARVRMVAGDITVPGFFDSNIAPGTESIYHHAAVVSGQAETDFDTGMRVNWDATRALLDRCRTLFA
jgi:nucleoside-diphosphate-sugar epimerase